MSDLVFDAFRLLTGPVLTTRQAFRPVALFAVFL